MCSKQVANFHVVQPLAAHPPELKWASRAPTELAGGWLINT